MRTYAGQVRPNFKTVEEVFEYTKSNMKELKSQEIFDLLNTLFSLRHYSELQKLPVTSDFLALAKDSHYAKDLTGRQLVRVAKRYAQLEVQEKESWEPVLAKLTTEIAGLTDDELYELMIHTNSIVNEMVEHPLWKQLLGELGGRLDGYKAREIINIMRFAVLLQVKSADLWTQFEIAIKAKLADLSKDEIMVIFQCYEAIKRDPVNILRELRKAIFNKML